MADRSVVVRLEAQAGKYKAEMAQAAAATEGLEEAAEGTQTRLRGMGKETSHVGGMVDDFLAKIDKTTVALAGAGGLAAGIGLATTAAVSWESAFADVQKTVDGTPEQLQGISEGLRDMATQIPTSANDLAEIASSAGQLGIQTENVEEFTRIIADLGEASNLAGQEGATSLARLANITQMSQDDFDRLASTVVALGNNLATTEAEITEMALRVAGAGETVGMTEDDILALSAAMSSVGIRAQMGGSAISRVMLSINTEVAESSEMVQEFADVAGMSAEQFSESWREDAATALTAVIEGLGRVRQEGGNVAGVIDDMGFTNRRTRDTLLRLSNASDLVNESLNRGEKAWEENIALTEEAQRRYETAAAKMQTAMNSIRQTGVAIGGTFLPVVGKASEAVTNLLTAPDAVEEEQGGYGGIMHSLIATFTSAGDAAEEAGGKAANAGPKFHGMGSELKWVSERAGGAATPVADLAWEIDAAGSAAGVSVQPTNAYETAIMQAGEEADESTSKVEALGDALRAQTDPAFAVLSSFQKIQQAQRDYNAAVEEHGRNSREAREAALSQSQAVAELEAQVMSGEVNWAQFNDRLDAWVSTGQMTAEQADIIKERIREIDPEIEKIEGTHQVTVEEIGSRKARDRVHDATEAMRAFDRQRPHVTLGADTSPAHRALDEVGRRLDQITGGTHIFEFDVRGSGTGDGPGLPMPSGSGSGLTPTQRAQQAMAAVPGEQYITSGFRTPAENARVGGAPRSRHMLAPPLNAVDIGGANLPLVQQYLAAIGGNAELLGPLNDPRAHGDHVHVAHGGGEVTRAGIRPNELLTKLEAGEGIISASGMASLEGGTVVSLEKAIAELTDTMDSQRREQEKRQRSRRRESLVSDLGEAQDAVADAETAEEAARATERLVEARRALRQHDREARRAEERLRLEQTKSRLETELAIAQNRRELRMAQMTSREKIAALGERMDAEERFTDRWMDLRSQRMQLLENQRQEARQAHDEALSGLNQMLDERERLQSQLADNQRQYQQRRAEQVEDHQEQVAEARERYRQKQLDARQKFEDRRAELIESRRDELLSGFEFSIRSGSSAGTLTNRLQASTDDLRAWQEGLDELRSRGMSEELIDAMGLGAGPEALNQIRALTSASQSELAELNEAWADRMSQVNDQVADEQENSHSRLSSQIRQAQQDMQATLQEAQRQHQERLREMQAQHEERLADMQDDFHDRQQELKSQLEAVGQDQGRTFSEAVAAGLASGIPAIAEQARRVQDLLRQVNEAEAALDQAQSSGPRTVGDVLDLSKVSDPKLADIHENLAELGPAYLDTLAADPSRYYDMDSGGVLPPGLSMVNNQTGRNEFVLTADQLQSVGAGGGGQVNIALEIDGRQFASATAEYTKGELEDMRVALS